MLQPPKGASVPNVPCGVESHIPHSLEKQNPYVPNVPCGVESLFPRKSLKVLEKFLMYRVELKDEDLRPPKVGWDIICS